LSAFSGGAEQLLVDSNHLESVLLALHWARPSDVTARGGLRAESVEGERRPASGSFGRLVKREMQRPKAVLSLLSAPAEGLVDAFTERLPSGSVVDLQHVMGLQGLPKPRQEQLLNDFRGRKQQPQ